MNRLAPHLALAMIGTTVLTLVILVASLQLAEYRAYWSLPSEVRAQVPPPRLEFFRKPRLHSEAEVRPAKPALSLSEQARSFEARRRLQERMLLFGILLSVGLTVLLALLVSRSIARPIAAVSKAAGGVAAGDFSARVKLSEKQRRSSLETDRLAVTFNEMSGALETYERERKAMVADIAHELRTPLTALQMRLEAIQDGLVPLSDAQVEHLLKQTALLSRLVEDLRTLSLADAGRLTLNRQPTDLTELAEEVLEGFRERAEQQRITLVLTGAPVSASVDQTRLMQVLGNLLDNALRVTPAGGTVQLSVVGGASGVQLEVSDSAPGIPEDDLPHIFERFVQGKDTKVTKGASGLGLAIVAALVKLHNGSVQVANRAGGGASFQVSLPVLPQG